MNQDQPVITPPTRNSDLLKAYPELEEVLVSVAPAFKKLRNPVLRRTVAKVTSLAQAARVGGVSVIELVQQLRKAAGQPELEVADTELLPESQLGETPGWFHDEKISNCLDARQLIDAGEQPMGRVLHDLDELPSGGIYELITPFEPAPLIDKAKDKGFSVWIRASGTSEYRSYFFRR